MNLRYGTKFGAILGIAALFAWLPNTADAQSTFQDKFQFDGRGGVAIPAGNFADIADVGPNFGLKLAYDVHPRVALRVDGDVGIFPGAEFENGTVEVPDMRAWHYSGGVEVQALQPEMPWSVVANVGAGATTLDSDAFGMTNQDFNETYFAVNGGVKVGYDVTRRVNLFVGGKAYLTFTDEEDTAAFAALNPDVESFDTMWSFPINAGFNIRLR